MHRTTEMFRGIFPEGESFSFETLFGMAIFGVIMSPLWVPYLVCMVIADIISPVSTEELEREARAEEDQREAKRQEKEKLRQAIERDRSLILARGPKDWVYVLTHDRMPGLCKIGWTSRSPEARVRELSSATGVPGRFALAFSFKVFDGKAVESTVHHDLEDFRVDRSEFFSVTLHEAKRVVLLVAEEELRRTNDVDQLPYSQKEFLEFVRSHPGNHDAAAYFREYLKARRGLSMAFLKAYMEAWKP